VYTLLYKPRGFADVGTMLITRQATGQNPSFFVNTQAGVRRAHARQSSKLLAVAYLLCRLCLRRQQQDQHTHTHTHTSFRQR
jgi:hypothetical protein